MSSSVAGQKPVLAIVALGAMSPSSEKISFGMLRDQRGGLIARTAREVVEEIYGE